MISQELSQLETFITSRTYLKKIHLLSLAVVLGLFGFAPQSNANVPQCTQVLSSLTPTKSVHIPKKLFNQLTRKLRATLGGKLATVWRSEWKTKLNHHEANLYVHEMLLQLLTPQTYSIIISGLDTGDPQFVRHVHRRLYDLKTKNLLHSHDLLMVRDAPTPEGAEDSTFTYYSRAIEDGTSKHQIRVRTYLREIKPEQIPLHERIEAFDQNGNPITFEKNHDHSVQVTMIQNEVQQKHILSIEQFQQMFPNPVFFAPHGQSFKLEVKTALKDQIGSAPFPILGGNHMVQKLDVSLTPQQVMQLFKPMTAPTTIAKTAEAQARVHHLKNQLLEKTTDINKQERIEAVMQVLIEGVNASPDFLVLLGATHYQRSAFESTSGFQTTVDWAQVVYQGIYMGSHQLMTPANIAKFSQKFIPDESATRHVELKFPVNAVKTINGLTLYDPESQALIPTTELDISSYLIAAKIYALFVRSEAHPGKFNYLKTNGINPDDVNGD